ncbi:MAG: RICIN domain-containing protein [Coriobacteriales bacterium]|jgi:lipoprotein-anchoring transpeptidase ErfK/SrfK|nr:RICIN domain-containing protein [Coriobacteriales bacterium]
MLSIIKRVSCLLLTFSLGVIVGCCALVALSTTTGPRAAFIRQAWAATAAEQPTWAASHIKDGYYCLLSALKGKAQALTTKDGSYYAGDKVELHKRKGSGAQKWYIAKATGGCYTLKNARSDDYLSLRGKAKAGTRIEQVYLSSAAKAKSAQRFFIKSAQISGQTVYSLQPKTANAYQLAVNGNKNKEGADIKLTKAAPGQIELGCRFLLKKTSWKNSATRKGSDTFVQVDLSRQRLVMFKGGVKKLECDVIGGRPGKPTPRGTFRVFAKKHNYTMYGATYAAFTHYAMEFKTSYYLHDATWRNWKTRAKVGPSYYKKHGSHGCVNMSLSSAKKLNGLIKKGILVKITK